MHAAAMGAVPPLLYWNGATVECLNAVRQLRADGVPVFFTIDAGPQVKAICLPDARPRVEAALRAIPGVLDVLREPARRRRGAALSADPRTRAGQGRRAR